MGKPPPSGGTVRDSFTLAGALLGAFVAVRREGAFPISTRLEAGLLAGALVDERNAFFTDSAQLRYPRGLPRSRPRCNTSI